VRPLVISTCLIVAGWAHSAVGDSQSVGDWKLSHQGANCIIDGEPDGHWFRLVLGLSKNSTSELMMLEFLDPDFKLSTGLAGPAVLAFDSGTIEAPMGIGKESGVDDRYALIIMTDDLKKSIGILGKASSLTITVESKSTPYNLPGFGAAVQEMYRCAQHYAT
jgi:hypothetical protein